MSELAQLGLDGLDSHILRVSAGMAGTSHLPEG